VVSAVGDIESRFLLGPDKDGGYQRDVRKMSSASKGIVEDDQRVPFKSTLELVYGSPDRHGCRSEMNWNMRCLGDGLTAAVKEGARMIPALFDVG